MRRQCGKCWRVSEPDAYDCAECPPGARLRRMAALLAEAAGHLAPGNPLADRIRAELRDESRADKSPTEGK